MGLQEAQGGTGRPKGLELIPRTWHWESERLEVKSQLSCDPRQETLPVWVSVSSSVKGR